MQYQTSSTVKQRQMFHNLHTLTSNNYIQQQDNSMSSELLTNQSS